MKYYQNMGKNECFSLKRSYLWGSYECLPQPFHNLWNYSITWSMLVLVIPKNSTRHISKQEAVTSVGISRITRGSLCQPALKSWSWYLLVIASSSSLKLKYSTLGNDIRRAPSTCLKRRRFFSLWKGLGELGTSGAWISISRGAIPSTPLVSAPR